MHRARTYGWSVIVGILALVLSTATAYAKPEAKRQRHEKSNAPSWGEVTKASWYGKSFNGRATAAGRRFDATRLTAAHRTLQFGTKVRVTEVNSGRSVVVEITDRGPYVRGRGIDLSYAAARELGIVHRGVSQVRLEPEVAADAVASRTGHDVPQSSPVFTALLEPARVWMPKAIVE